MEEAYGAKIHQYRYIEAVRHLFVITGITEMSGWVERV